MNTDKSLLDKIIGIIVLDSETIGTVAGVKQCNYFLETPSALLIENMKVKPGFNVLIWNWKKNIPSETSFLILLKD